MSLDSTVLSVLLADNVTKLIFRYIVKNRTAVFKELLASLKSEESVAKDRSADIETQNEELRKLVEDSVSRLKDVDLIKEQTAPIEDFNKYYVTSDGLTAEKQLRLADAR